jgi:hypothetical protein
MGPLQRVLAGRLLATPLSVAQLALGTGGFASPPYGGFALFRRRDS